ncbi:Tetratricopeptide domain protein [Elusimicrobium minutum Pei191]|uniref:Tetratricopeptide domain protein n=1 Tax=Elusimicrobium minutum (strain Pei191) TaxID=445932 RepID=B2KC28_ELUMP|nr:tetratricopeptide repeat protein [Elusimicrobium minutum]ACC98155.1 Tetratricopeptide domain protein [Elusimicrobium minutum Pei191]
MIEKLEQLLDAGNHSEVIKKTKNYKGKDGAVYFMIGEARRMLGAFMPAIATYKKAAKLTNDAALKMDILLSLASCERTLGNAEQAFKTASAVYEFADGLDYEDYKIAALQEAGMAQRAWGRLDDALDSLNEVLAHYTAEKDHAGISFILWAKGGIFRLQGKFAEGIKSFKDSLKHAVKAKDKINQAYAYCGLAGIARISGDINACVNNYKLADKIFVKTQDTFGKAYTNCGMANGLRQQGKLDEALKRYKNADELYTIIGDKVDLGFVKWGRADVLKRKNKLQQSLLELKEAEKLFDGSDEKRGQILTRLSMAQVLYALGQKDTAVEMFDAAVAKAKHEGLNTYLEIYT